MENSNSYLKIIESIDDELSKVDNLFPNKAEFDKVISVLKIKNRKDFFLKLFPLLIEGNITDFEFNKIFSVINPELSDVYNSPDLTDEDGRGFVNYVHHCVKYMCLCFVSEDTTNTRDIKAARQQLDSMNVDSNLMFNIDAVPSELITYLDKKSKKKSIRNSTVNDRFFEWNFDERKLNKLFEQLTAPRYQLIEKDYNKFKSLFIINNTKQDDKSIKIKWLKRPMNYRALCYLFHQLCKTGFINNQQERKLKLIISVRLLDFNEKSISLENLKKSYSRFDPTTSKSQYIKDIEDIISSL